MNYLRNRIKYKIILFLLGVASLYSIYRYFDSEQKEINNLDDYKYLASLPAKFVNECQHVSIDSGIPWELYSAYYQVHIDEKLISNFPQKATLNNLSKLFEINKNDKSYKELLSLKTNDQVLIDNIYNRYLLLKKHSDLFSKEYYFPIANKVYFIDTWGEDRENGKRAHKGTDIFAPKGTPIYAVTSGTIERMGWDTLGGNRIGIRGKDGLYYYYAHLMDFAPRLKIGDNIPSGKLIGYVGNTGNAINTPYHLHFGIEIGNNQWINPYNLLSYWHRDIE